jgi:hypothetical protein
MAVRKKNVFNRLRLATITQKTVMCRMAVFFGCQLSQPGRRALVKFPPGVALYAGQLN